MGPDRVSRQDVRPRVIHVTTSHHADDPRIFDRECRSLAATGRYDVYLAAAGAIPGAAGVTLIPLAPVPNSRGAAPSAAVTNAATTRT